MRRDWLALAISLLPVAARAADDPAPATAPANDPAPTAPPLPAGEASLDPVPDGAPASETIEVTGAAPAGPGTITLDARTARRAPGALGEPLRALALLPGTVAPIAAAGAPVIRGAMPGESRFAFDGIELPLLYHFGLGNQVIHPSFIGDLELSAGGYGAEHGHLIGGLVALTPSATDEPRTELRANPIEVGAYRAQALSSTTSLASAARVGTLALVKAYKPEYDIYYVDQQARLVHRFGNGDQLALTSLGAFDYFRRPDNTFGDVRTDLLGFHRLDARWTRRRDAWSARAGIETQADTLFSKVVYAPSPPPEPTRPTDREGGKSLGVRGYADASATVAPWLTVRGGGEARHRTLFQGITPFDLNKHAENENDPFLSLATRVEAGGAWAALDVRVANLTVTPGMRVDVYRAELYHASTRHLTSDPRLAVTADLPRGVRAGLAIGAYSAPPQISVLERSTMMGPLPMVDGAGSAAGMNRAVQAEASLRTPLGDRLEASVAAYYRTTHRAVDFGMIGEILQSVEVPCPVFNVSYRHVETEAIGSELMIRGALSPSLTGWLAYSLAKQERDLVYMKVPGDYDQRHTLNATAQWRRGRWMFGATGHLHTGRALRYPHTVCAGSSNQVTIDFVRRPAPTWRIDLRAERGFQFPGWRMSLFAEIQNASLTKEVVGYDVSPSGGVAADTVFVPLAVIGVEAVL